MDPVKYFGYLADLDPSAFAHSEEVQQLNVYAEGVEGIPVDDLILSHFYNAGYGDTAELVQEAQYEKWPALAAGAALPTGGVYFLRDAAGRVVYVGRTASLAQRALQWKRLLPKLDFDIFARTDSKIVRRGLEQIAYDQYQPIRNKIRPISLRNPKIAQYLRAGRNFLLGNGRERE